MSHWAQSAGDLVLLGALRAFDADRALKGALGPEFSGGFLKLKMQEWHSFKAHLTERERATTLDI